MKVGIFMGTYDPMTNKEVQNIVKAGITCDDIFVFVRKSSEKREYLSPAKNRAKIIQAYLSNLSVKALPLEYKDEEEKRLLIDEIFVWIMANYSGPTLNNAEFYWFVTKDECDMIRENATRSYQKDHFQMIPNPILPTLDSAILPFRPFYTQNVLITGPNKNFCEFFAGSLSAYYGSDFVPEQSGVGSVFYKNPIVTDKISFSCNSYLSVYFRKGEQMYRTVETARVLEREQNWDQVFILGVAEEANELVYDMENTYRRTGYKPTVLFGDPEDMFSTILKECDKLLQNANNCRRKCK